MALSGSVSTNGYQGRYLIFNWSATQDIAKNESTITWSLKGAGDASSSYYKAGNFNVTLDNDVVFSSGSDDRITLYKNTMVASSDTHGKWTKKHNDDGTCSFSVYIHGAIYDYAVNCKGSDSFTLNTIPRVSQPSVSATSVTMGNSVTIYTNSKSSSFTHTITATLGSFSKTWTGIYGSTRWDVGDLASYINNKTSGTATISCTTYNGSTVLGTKTCTLTVNVPAATTPTLPTSTSANPVYAGQRITIGLPMLSTNYGHLLYYHFKDESGTISLDSNKQWIVPYSLCSQIPSAWDGTITITCVTKNGNATVGEKTASLYFKVPDNDTTKPKMESISLSPITSLNSPFNTLYIQGYSKVKATYKASAPYSSVKSVTMTVQSKTVTGTTTTATSGLLSGTAKAVSFTVTNARGQTKTFSATIPQLYPYEKPLVSPLAEGMKVECYRCDDGGYSKADGIHLKIRAKRGYSTVGGYNTCELWYRLKVYDGLPIADNVVKKTLLSPTTSGNYDSIVDEEQIEDELSYTVEVGATDTIGNKSSIAFFIPTKKVTFHLAEGGNGAAFGGFSDGDGLLIPWKTRFTGAVQGNVYGLGRLTVIEDESDINTFTIPGVYSIKSNVSAQTMTNLPFPNAGKLIVSSGDGLGKTNGEWANILQEYISFDGRYRSSRLLYTQNEADKWYCYDWESEEDFVVKSGTQGNWTYRKWRSGIVECWGTITRENVAITTAVGATGWYQSAVILDYLPSGLFKTVTHADVNPVFWTDIALADEVLFALSKDHIQWSMRCSISVTPPKLVYTINVKGTWK